MPTLEPESVQTNGRPAGVPRDFIMRFSVEQYHQMIDKEILTDADGRQVNWVIGNIGGPIP